MDRFSRLNPKAVLLFFVFEIIASICVFNPILLSFSFMAALFYNLKLTGKKAVKAFLCVLPIMLLATVFNFIFTHYGTTVLFVLSDMNFTFEALFYGFSQGLMLGAVLLWFSAFSAAVTSQGFLSVFSGLVPNISLVLIMVFSFLPRLRKNAAEISDARMLLAQDESRLKKSIANFSALITMTLEESIETADSMKARGFGKKRTVYSKYRFNIRDFIVIAVSAAFFAVVLFCELFGRINFIFEPVIIFDRIPLLAFFSYIILSFLPLIIDLTEDVKWYFLKQKI